MEPALIALSEHQESVSYWGISAWVVFIALWVIVQLVAIPDGVYRKLYEYQIGLH